MTCKVKDAIISIILKGDDAMLLFYIRHGDPIYKPDSLTHLGERQAEALAKRLALHGIDRVFSSTSNRAMLTANPTCELIKKEMTLLDFAKETYAFGEFSVELDPETKKRTFAFNHLPTIKKFNDPAVRALGEKWYDHEYFSNTGFKSGIERISKEADAFLASLGYEHDREAHSYKITAPNDERVALFAHAGFGLAFLSSVLDIPYPLYCTRYDMCHSGMTVIEFKNNEDGYTIPRVLVYSDDSHIYKEGLPTNYNNRIRF